MRLVPDVLLLLLHCIPLPRPCALPHPAGPQLKSGSIVAAGAVVPPNTVVPSGQVGHARCIGVACRSGNCWGSKRAGGVAGPVTAQCISTWAYLEDRLGAAEHRRAGRGAPSLPGMPWMPWIFSAVTAAQSRQTVNPSAVRRLLPC